MLNIKALRPSSGLVALIVWAVVAVATYTGLTDPAKHIEFDYLSIITPSSAELNPVIIVGIDDASLADLNMQWPWPRGVHAKAVERLKHDGASVIAFDIVFSESSDPVDDRLFAKAIQEAGNVVLASDVAYLESEYYEQLIRVEPLQMFLEAGASTGFSNITLDSDLIVRNVPVSGEPFWRAIANRYTRSESVDKNDAGAMRHIHYLGPAHTFKYVSYYQMLDRELLPPDYFRDKVVIIGLDIKSSASPTESRADMFATPFIRTTNLLTPGVELVSTMVVNSLNDDFIYSQPAHLSLAIALFALLVIVIGNRDWHPVKTAVATIAAVTVIVICCFLIFRTLGIWVASVPTILSGMLYYLASGGIGYLRESRLKRAIRNAFEYYVSPNIVKEMINNPSKLALGGEKRVVTLMFTDLAGFTGFSEKLAPEDVAIVLNKHFTAMTKIIIDNGGTVDKFIGDAIMAFWGAPVEDDRQASHACQAAIKMQHIMQRLRMELVAAGMPEIYMRIGLNTGEAVVGNMGSDDRFDYTALGDNVNLASRLEGVNKYYGTDILVSESTAHLVGQEFPLVYIDKVRVKGKTKPVALYTIFNDEVTGERINSAMSAFSSSDWALAENEWQDVAENGYPELANIYLSRISRLKNKNEIVDDDFITTLDAK